MMHTWAVTAVYTLVLSSIAVACLSAGRCNYRGWRDSRRRPPLEASEVIAAAPATSLVPSNWPPPSAVQDVGVAAAYRDYARDRCDSLVMAGDLAVVAGGAGLGASLPAAVVGGGWQTWPAAVAALVAAVGLLLRRRGQEKWVEVSRLYEQRRLHLSQSEADAPIAPRRTLRTLWRR